MLFITIGIIAGTFGAQGELRVIPESDHPQRLESLTEMDAFIYHRGIRDVYEIIAARQGQSFWFLRLKGIDSQAAARSLVGGQLQIPKAKALPLPAESFYIFQILGLKVRTEAGTVLGHVREVLQPGANDVYVVQGSAGQEYLIPAIKDVVMEIDIAAGNMLIRPLPGLLDISTGGEDDDAF